MPAFRHRFICCEDHDWHDVTNDAGKPVTAICPVCGARPRLWTANVMADRPIIRIESAAEHEQDSGKVLGDGGYFVVLQNADGTRQVRARFQMSWSQVMDAVKDIRELPFEKAARCFVFKTEGTSGLPKAKQMKYSGKLEGQQRASEELRAKGP